MANITLTATGTPYAVTNSTTRTGSSTPVNTASSTSKVSSTASTTPSASTTSVQGANVANSKNTATVSASTTSAYGNSATNNTSKVVSSTTPSSSGTPANMVGGTLERNGGSITIYLTDASAISNNSSTTPGSSGISSSTTPSTGAVGNIEKFDGSYLKMIEDIDKQIRILAYDSSHKNSNPEGAKKKLQELQALRKEIYQRMAPVTVNNILMESTNKANYKEFSFSKEEEKAFDLMVQEKIMNHISSEKYSWKKWLEYTPVKKNELLLELVKYGSKQLGIETPTIRYFTPEAGDMTMGKYVSETNTILINAGCLPKSTSNEVVKILIHELRHAYQNAVIDNPGLYVVSDETRNEWQNNYNVNNYIDGGSNGYREQPVEWDAINFAKEKNYINAVDKQLITYEGSWEK